MGLRPACASFSLSDSIPTSVLDEIVYTAGNPVQCCVTQGKRQILSARGADPNANVYASGSPLFRVYRYLPMKLPGACAPTP